MNERIQELAEQAREYATTRHPVSNIILSVNSDLFEQKFAELIVRECINGIANDTANYEGVGMMSYYQGVQDAVKSIRKHFGVEE
jgi:hypothetical protein